MKFHTVVGGNIEGCTYLVDSCFFKGSIVPDCVRGGCFILSLKQAAAWLMERSAESARRVYRRPQFTTSETSRNSKGMLLGSFEEALICNALSSVQE